MSFWRRISLLWLAAAHLTVFVVAQVPATSPETLSVTTQLVVLDATVLDKAGHVVTQPLTRDDFQIEENKKPQEIYSFESAAEHSAAAAGGDAAKSPRLIFVLDELDYPYQMAHTTSWNTIEQLNEEKFERDELMAYLREQPETLREPAEVLILTHHGYRILVQPTRDRRTDGSRGQAMIWPVHRIETFRASSDADEGIAGGVALAMNSAAGPAGRS